MRYVYYYYGQIISKSQFIQEVPENWENEVDEYGEYNFGGYKAVRCD